MNYDLANSDKHKWPETTLLHPRKDQDTDHRILRLLLLLTIITISRILITIKTKNKYKQGELT